MLSGRETVSYNIMLSDGESALYDIMLSGIERVLYNIMLSGSESVPRDILMSGRDVSVFEIVWCLSFINIFWPNIKENMLYIPVFLNPHIRKYFWSVSQSVSVLTCYFFSSYSVYRTVFAVTFTFFPYLQRGRELRGDPGNKSHPFLHGTRY